MFTVQVSPGNCHGRFSNRIQAECYARAKGLPVSGIKFQVEPDNEPGQKRKYERKKQKCKYCNSLNTKKWSRGISHRSCSYQHYFCKSCLRCFSTNPFTGKVTVAQQVRIYQARVEGVSYQKIRKELNHSSNTIRRAIDTVEKMLADEILTLHDFQLDDFQINKNVHQRQTAELVAPYPLSKVQGLSRQYLAILALRTLKIGGETAYFLNRNRLVSKLLKAGVVYDDVAK